MSSTKDRVLDRWEEEISKPSLKGKISFEDSIQMLINLCMTCDDYHFDGYVERLLYAIPVSWRDAEFDNALEVCTTTSQGWQHKYNCGIAITNKAMGSPYLVDYDVTDWKQIFNCILNLYNRRELLLSKQRTEIITDAEG